MFAVGLYYDAVYPSPPHEILAQYQCYLLLLSFALLSLVLIPGVAESSMVVLDGLIWASLISAPELAKVFIVIYVAAYLERHADEVRGAFVGFMKPFWW